MSPDDLIRSFFKFLPPSEFIQGPGAKEPSQGGLVGMISDEAAAANTELALTAEGHPPESRPLRTTHYASSAKHVLAHIIKSIYSHFRGRTCQQAAKRLDGAARFLLRSNSKAAVMEYLLVYSLIQGNAASAVKFQNTQSSLEDIRDDQPQVPHTPHVATNSSPEAGIYNPVLLVSYFDVGTGVVRWGAKLDYLAWL